MERVKELKTDPTALNKFFNETVERQVRNNPATMTS